ncbi:biotin--[acetyl-CoA-carboxylase] ligase [Actinotignum sp. GS-2025e]|uniref:biotin--[acetyl-CoA-carboxylase] ligase n=1 Tax=Actinotignum TaxID=1653174 RepID=UPI0003FEFA94|nr:biotin--[acetyl-CoA-carboxylase] ligase [Actinotignum schaalii]WQN44526.1 biotin--[acetyl-CoA-carboxylase] ligase [Actinotignum schaalii]
MSHVHSGNVLFPRTASALGEVGLPGAALLHTELTTSTQDDLAELWLSSGGAPAPGLVCGLIADEQSDGRGRMGRSWFSTKDGSLLFSVLIAVPEVVRAELSWVTFAGALAARAALEKLGADVAISWPNDIVTRPHAAKLAGLLGEVVSTDAAGNIGVVLGVGINLGLRAAELPTPTSASLATAGFPVPSRDEVAAAYLRELGARLAALTSACGSGIGNTAGSGAVVPETRARHLEASDAGASAAKRSASAAERSGLLAELNATCATLREGITVNRPRDTPVHGRGVQILADGALVVATTAGDVHISTGEVSLLGRVAPSEGK